MEDQNNARSPSFVRMVVASLVVLTLFSGYVIVYNVGTEPFTSFLAFQVVLQVGGSCVLLFGWLVYVIAIAIGVLKKRISPWVFVSFPWVYIVCYLLVIVMIGYIEDIQMFSHV